VLSIHTQHDANLTLAQGNRVIKFIEVEKISKCRYFSFARKEETFRSEFINYVMPYLNNYKIDQVVLSWVNESQELALHRIFENVTDWQYVNHHLAHAWSAYVFVEPQNGDLIISYDGGGDLKDTFKVFEYKNGEICLISESDINLGITYRTLGVLSPEIEGDKDVSYGKSLALSGKVMGLSPYGKVNRLYESALQTYYLRFRNKTIKENITKLLLDLGFDGYPLPALVARDVLATSQEVFENLFFQTVEPFLYRRKYKRIILVGGCALNVILNTILFNKCRLPIFIPPCPNDCGISLGALKFINPNIHKLPSACEGLELEDAHKLTEYINKFNGVHTSVSQLANLLKRGKIIGFLNGKLEIGPRSLGNRSLLASPLISGMKDKLNEIKGRERFRPVAPIVSEDVYQKYFVTTPLSPYMSFAPQVRAEYRNIIREIVHVDGSSRVQTVNPGNGVIYELVKEFGKQTDIEIIINTSFNGRGQPLLNSIHDALELMGQKDIDGVFVNGILFSKEEQA